ncbi:hypothetical protein CPB86DRAFT_789087 [Serendipita vermifera]|nr:hypothetical protein CPB86DRAFT_790524 [Serendipita vermifera]PVF94388.1 hypothetical protein CPB86DRAFT_789087 [Serendipita vermifera]
MYARGSEITKPSMPSFVPLLPTTTVTSSVVTLFWISIQISCKIGLLLAALFIPIQSYSDRSSSSSSAGGRTWGG